MPAATHAIIERVAELIGAKKYHYANEVELQDAIEIVLFEGGLETEREVELSPQDRIDFTVGAIGVEVKIQGEKTSVARQLIRYAKHDAIEGLILVTTSAVLRLPPDTTIEGKPVRTVYLNPLL